MSFNSVLIIIGLILCCVGTFISLSMIVTASLRRIMTMSTWGYLPIDILKDASTQKYFGIIGFSVLVIGTVFQIHGTIGSTDKSTFWALIFSGLIVALLMVVICLGKRSSDFNKIDKQFTKQ